MSDEARAEFRFTDAEWRQYQAMPEQGYSHRGQLEFFVNRWQASRKVEAAPSGTAPREVAHIECDYIPNLGPSHCHLCGERAGHPISWAAAHPSRPVQVEVTDEMVDRAALMIRNSAYLPQHQQPEMDPDEREYFTPIVRAALTAALTPPVTEIEES